MYRAKVGSPQKNTYARGAMCHLLLLGLTSDLVREVQSQTEEDMCSEMLSRLDPAEATFRVLKACQEI